jgi:KaiC/GvpD/RAD55 family RecA-like ATPase
MAGQVGRSLKLSTEGIKKANEALANSFVTKSDLATHISNSRTKKKGASARNTTGISRTTIDAFFDGTPKNANIFKEICAALKLKWQDVADVAGRCEPQPLASFSVNSQPSNRLIRLEELKRESRAWCIERFRIAVSSKEEAVSLADDLSIGSPPSNLRLKPGKVSLVVGELGIGKTLIAQRLFQQAIQQAQETPNTAIPVYLESSQWRQERPLKKAVEAAADGLGNPRTQGAIVILDELDKPVETGLASQVLSEAHRLVEEWDNTTVIITSRPTRYTDDVQGKIIVPLLSEEQAYALIERVSKLQMTAMICSGWTESIRDAIRRPLFALIVARYLRRADEKAPRSKGELLSWLVEDALEKVNADRSNCDRLLKRLAMLSVECGGDRIRATDVAPTKDALKPLLDSRLVVERSRGIISFPLPILTEWFAAQSLADDPSKVETFVSDPRQLENWRYPLTIATATFGSELVSKLLVPMAKKYPAFAAEIVREGTTRWGDEEVLLPSPRKCGQQIQTAMQAWIEGIGSLAELIAPIRQDGTVKAIGVGTDGAWLEVAWYEGSENLQNVVDLPLDGNCPDSWEWYKWPRVTSCRPGHESAWAWRWTLDKLVKNLSRQLESPRLLVDSEPLIREAAWRAALAIVKYRPNSKLTTLKWWELDEVPLVQIEETLSEIEAKAKLNCDVMLPDIGNSFRIKEQQYYLKQLRKEVNRLQSLGESALHNPWPNFNPTQCESRGQGYSLERLRIRAEKVYKGALDAYQLIVNTWFKQLIPGLRIAAMLPARLVGEISPSPPTPGPFGSPPYWDRFLFDWFLEPLPENAQNEIEIAINEHYLPLVETHRGQIDFASKQLSLLRPNSAIWIRNVPYNGNFDDHFFRHIPATALAYSWLQEDLIKIFGWGSFPRRIRLD